jgi:hypothetical protein
MNIELRLSVEELCKQRRVAIDSVRCCKLPLTRGGGVLTAPSAISAKTTKQLQDERSCRMMRGHQEFGIGLETLQSKEGSWHSV